MKFKYLPAFAALLIGSAISAVIITSTAMLETSLAQSKPDAPSAAKNDIAKPANPLALTDTEKADLANLNAKFLQADAILTARLRVVLGIECQDCEEDYAIGLAIADARKFYREQVRPAQAAYLKRLEEAQQRADCLGCALRGDVFVKPEGKK